MKMKFMFHVSISSNLMENGVFWYTLVPTNSNVSAKTVYIGTISKYFFSLVLILGSEWKHFDSVPPPKSIPYWFNVNFQLERYFGKSIKIKLLRLLTSNKVYSFELCEKLNGAMSSILWRMITACLLICIKRLAIKLCWSMIVIIDWWLARLLHTIYLALDSIERLVLGTSQRIERFPKLHFNWNFQRLVETGHGFHPP